MSQESALVIILVIFVMIFGLLFFEVVEIIAAVFGILLVIGLIGYLILVIYEEVYYHSKSFHGIKSEVKENAEKCNELNAHVEELKSRFLSIQSTDYGSSEYRDSSLYRFRRPFSGDIHNNTPNEYFCSLSVCKNAQAQPIKYLCKYFNIPIDEISLDLLEPVLNDFCAAKDGQDLLIMDRKEIISKYRSLIPLLIRKCRQNKFFERIGYQPIDLSTDYYPTYYFRYVSAGANSKMDCKITLDVDNLSLLVSYIYDNLRRMKTITYQRSLMTQQLRKEIMERDHCTCRHCGLSTAQEPHLLLEIDHIVPLSKGGLTTRDNLQTLCWKCNRTKGDRLLDQQ